MVKTLIHKLKQLFCKADVRRSCKLKTKLLKTLRKRFVIEQRGKEFRLIDRDSLDYDNSITDWTDIKSVIIARRSEILSEARKYKVGKHNFT